MGAGISFGRGPQEAGVREKSGCVLEGRKPVKSVLVTFGQQGLVHLGPGIYVRTVPPEHGSLGTDR